MSGDPRVEAAKVAITDRLGARVDFLVKHQLSARLAQAALAAADRVDPLRHPDDATVERVARALWDHDMAEESSEWRDMAWNDMGGSEPSWERGEYEIRARAVLAALTEAKP